MRYVFYWRYGEYLLAEGDEPHEAFASRGYAGGAVSAIDFYLPFDPARHPQYVYNKDKKSWQRAEGLAWYTLHERESPLSLSYTQSIRSSGFDAVKKRVKELYHADSVGRNFYVTDKLGNKVPIDWFFDKAVTAA